MADFSKFLNPAVCFLGGLVSASVCVMMPAATMAAGEEGHVRPVVARVLENVRKLRAVGTAMMINGGKSVPGYTEHFICVDQVATCGSRPDSPL